MKLLKMLLVTLLSSQLAFATGTPPGSPPPERTTNNLGDKTELARKYLLRATKSADNVASADARLKLAAYRENGFIDDSVVTFDRAARYLFEVLEAPPSKNKKWLQMRESARLTLGRWRVARLIDDSILTMAKAVALLKDQSWIEAHMARSTQVAHESAAALTLARLRINGDVGDDLVTLDRAAEYLNIVENEPVLAAVELANRNERIAEAKELKERLERMLAVGVAEEPQQKRARPEPPPPLPMLDPAELLGLTEPSNTQKVAMTKELANSYMEQIRGAADIFLATNIDVLCSIVDARLDGVVGDETGTFKELAGYLRLLKHAEAILRLAELRHMELVGDDVITRYDAQEGLSDLLRSNSLTDEQRLPFALLCMRMLAFENFYYKEIETQLKELVKERKGKPELVSDALFFLALKHRPMKTTKDEIRSRAKAFEIVVELNKQLSQSSYNVSDPSPFQRCPEVLRAIATRHSHIPSLSKRALELADRIDRLLARKKQFEVGGPNQLSAAYELASLFIDGQLSRSYASAGLSDVLSGIQGEKLKTQLGAKALVAGLRVFGAPEHKKDREKMMTRMKQIIQHHGIESEVGALACRGMAILLYDQLRHEIKSYSPASHSDFVRLLRQVSEFLSADNPDGAWARLELFRVHFNALLNGPCNEPYELPQEARLSDGQLETYLNQVIESSPDQQDRTDALKYRQLLRKPIRERLSVLFRTDGKIGGGPDPEDAFRLAHLYDFGISRNDLPVGYIDYMMKFIERDSFYGKRTYFGLLAFIRAQIRNGIDEVQKNKLKRFLRGDFWNDYNDPKMFAERDRLLSLISQTPVQAKSDESSSSGSSDVASVAEPEQKKARRQEELIRKPYKWGQKYLPGEKPLSKPFVKGAAEKADWLKTPDVAFVRLKNVESTLMVLEESVKAIGMSATYLSELGLSMPARRTTFVFPGRMENALIPAEEDGGRVVLVVPAEQEAQARAWVSPHVDVLVIHRIEGVNEEELKLVTARRLASFLFAEHQKLADFFTLDDNVENIYGQNFKSWAEAYERFKETAEAKDATCLSGRTFRPEEDTDGKPSGAWDADMNDIGSKFFFFRGAALYALLDLHSLLPHRMRLCAEDLWMQTMLRAHKLGVGVVDRKAFVFTRSKKYMSVCKKTVGLADEWLRADLEQEIAAFNDPLMTQTLKAVAEQARLNIEANDRRTAGRADADLGKEAFDVHQKSKAKLAKRDERSESIIDLTLGNEAGEPQEKKQKNKQKSKILDATPLNALDVDANTGLSRRIELVRLVEAFIQKHEGKNAAFDHQLKALRSLTVDAFGEANAAFGVSATGTGKTTEFLMLIALAMQSDLFKNQNIALVAPRLNLVGQHYEEIEEFNIRFAGLLHIDLKKVVKVGSGNHSQEEIEANKLMNGGGYLAIFVDRSFKNFFLNKKADDKGKEEVGYEAAELTRRADLFSFFLIDELHTMSDNTLSYLLSYCAKKGALAVGFTATPGGKGKLFKKAPAFVYTSNQGVEGEFLCPWINDAIDIVYSRENFNALVPYAAQILKNFPHPSGGTLAEKNTFIFVPTIEDAQKVALALQAAGIKAEPVHSPKKLADGTILKSDPEGAIRRFEAGQTKVLVAVEMLTLGTDVKVDFVWLMTDQLSEDEYIQRRGRALRGGRRNDKVPVLAEDVVRARDSKIAYILSWKNALPQSKEHECPLLNDYALSPDYMGLLDDERHFGRFRIKPYLGDAQPDPMDVSEDEVTIYGKDAGAFQEDIDTQRANLESIRSMMRAEAHGHTGDFQVRVRATPADGDCGFHATDIARADYIAAVLKHYRGAGRSSAQFMDLVDEAMALLGVANIEQWAREYARSVDGHFVHYLDATNMRIMSLLFNLRIFLYTVDGERGEKFVPLQGEEGFVYAGNDYLNARDVHMAWINLEPLHSNGPLALNHFERLLTINDREFYPQNTFIGLNDALEEVGRGTTMRLRNFVANFAAAAILGLMLQKNMK